MVLTTTMQRRRRGCSGRGDENGRWKGMTTGEVSQKPPYSILAESFAQEGKLETEETVAVEAEMKPDVGDIFK
ncbi:hypothetical protein AKJ16_DCAP01049 [Drosera capensis]